MKNFFKYVLATIVGVLFVNIVFAILSFFIFGALVGMMSLSQTAPTVKQNSILKITFNHNIPDRASDNPFENFNIMDMSPEKQVGLKKILESIEYAATDDRISGIYLDLSDITSNFGALGTVEEIRNALNSFKSSGKFIYSYSNMGYSQKSYYLATVADSIFVNPRAPLLLYGMSSGVVFYKETLEKLGIQPEVIRVGKFKSAVEPFLDTKMSDANREQLEKYLNSLWGTLVDGIASARNIPVEKINNIVDNFRIYSPETFVSEGFFDGVVFEDQMLEKLKNACAVDSDKKLHFTALENYQHNVFTTSFSADKIAVIYAQGDIGMKQTTNSIGPELAETIRSAREDKSVKAIVLRINSPGGSALTSDIIWREVDLASKVKPVVASMGNVAASGGYYIACAANDIVADPTTLTGSIGIFGLLFSGEKLITEKIGLHTETVKTNQHSDFGGIYPLPLPIANRPLTPYERDVMQHWINEGYDTFLERVSQGRNMSKEAVNEVGQGRVWTGADALQIGLVDRLGGINEAIQLAAEKANLSSWQLTELPVHKNAWAEILFNFSESLKTKLLKEELGEHYDLYQQIKQAGALQGAVARIPYDITFH